jgi:hypothetical protein
MDKSCLIIFRGTRVQDKFPVTVIISVTNHVHEAFQIPQVSFPHICIFFRFENVGY